MREKKPLLVLAGPTAAGKTELSLRLAEALQGEIISADSMQVYRGMDIGSAKIPPEERRGVPHHLLDVCEPEESFDVAAYVAMAAAAAEEIYGSGHLPMLVGGTGFYIQAVLRGIDFSEGDRDEAYRRQLADLAAAEGNEALHARLAEVDPASAAAIHPNNVKRVIRALEYYRETGKRLSEVNEAQKALDSPYDFKYFVLNLPREELYRRIDRRVDVMLEQGLLEEVRKLRERGCRRGMVSMQGLGYKELLDHLDGLCTLDEATAKIKQESRRYAKRQLTWFRREKNVIWIEKSLFPDEDALLAEVLRIWRA